MARSRKLKNEQLLVPRTFRQRCFLDTGTLPEVQFACPMVCQEDFFKHKYKSLWFLMHTNLEKTFSKHQQKVSENHLQIVELFWVDFLAGMHCLFCLLAYLVVFFVLFCLGRNVCFTLSVEHFFTTSWVHMVNRIKHLRSYNGTMLLLMTIGNSFFLFEIIMIGC